MEVVKKKKGRMDSAVVDLMVGSRKGGVVTSRGFKLTNNFFKEKAICSHKSSALFTLKYYNAFTKRIPPCRRDPINIASAFSTVTVVVQYCL